jgi:anti-sigma28 factor (negative regulator of flagellin synthesis)
MKIENPRLDMTAPARADAIDSGRSTSTPTHPVGSADTVQLSDDLRLATQAINAIATPADVRPDAVAKGRALLTSGDLGTDTQALADRMLDAMTDPHGPDHT